ncbi:HlyD family type I secretion periplasmic adaptor subunit [Marinibactrum halimedae]|uniref:Membrane fusion protein (MFP) family protein n=1 Tax=Marinibactrum halimedae TaxID=1444977 RepID=A0AA37T2H1_9GAMM|nr:HlyD family type I secretion periplasmic adaptor subunit [Marinibactrum halimedae]MCD9457702.1 HlyD family type I secretion periplasmic adaptor subunit [Marinibactrum halimedae]GLS24924.1 HlyD family type I secretion periplasmic adaptor subunit [Marinibactrum halimedae]
MSAWQTLKEAWQNRDTLGDANHTRELAEFLPAALEIQEAPPNPLARWLAWSLLTVVMIAIVWALLGKVNIVASAEGKIIPSSRVKQVQPLEKGLIRELLVSEGQYVEKDQPLIELDTTLTQAEKQRLASELYSARWRLAVNTAMVSSIKSDTKELKSNSLTAPVNATEQDNVLYANLLQQQWLQYQAQAQALQSQLQRTLAEQSATQEVITKLEQTLPIAQKRVANYETLLGQDFVSENDYLMAEQERIQQAQDLAAERQRLKQLRASESEVREQMNLHRAQTSSALFTEMADLQRQIASLEEEFTKAQDTNAKQILYAPTAGRVQELMVNTVGGVVTEAQQLMLIVPDEEQLEVEVFLENKDIGFVSEGMTAEIKIHTFPFTKYGVINAEVTNVSDDATVDEQRGLIYRMQLKMAKNTLWVNKKEMRLQPGMAVTAEMQTGERRIIEFFLAPLLRASSESIRER